MTNSLQSQTTNEIRVSGGTHPTTLSGYIHTSLNSYQKTCVVAVGPKAISTAMKAIAVARLNIAGTDLDIVAKPEFAEIIMDDIKVNGNPLTEEGKDIVGEALELAVKEGNNNSTNKKENTNVRVHVGMKIFLEHVTRVVDTVGNETKKENNQTRVNSTHSANPANKNTKGGNKPRRKLSDEEMFLKRVGGNKPITLNSVGNPRV